MINKKIIVSLGDPAGIGPEIFLKALSKINSKEIFERIIVVSSLSVLDFVNSQLKLGFRFNELFNIKDTKPNKINFINVQNCPNYKVGKSDENNADYVIDCINIASDLAFENRFNLVTGPINKSVISSKIKNFQGHTEYLKNKFSCNDVLMLLANDQLKIGVATTHIPLNEVSNTVTEKLLINKITLLEKGLRELFNIQNPLMGILGLNPHAGERGEYGQEDKNIVQPTVRKLSNKFNLIGPLPADTAFVSSKCDGYLSMYHDQALPVIKTLDFHGTVNITIGLPFMRVSVDHGTAEDIASDFKADPSSMIKSIKIALNENKA